MTPKSEPTKNTSGNSYKSSISLGELLAQRRSELGLHLTRVERDTKIRREYLEYIEAGNYEKLPDDIYARGYVKNYADYLGLETAPILLLYKKERSARASGLKLRDGGVKARIGLTPIDSPRVVVTPRTFAILCAIALVVLVLGYLGWQFNGLAAAPTLRIDNANEEIVTSNLAYLSGHVNEGADVYVNNSPILSDSGGAFREQIALVDGTNQISVSAKNKLGKTTTVTKTYVARLPRDITASTTPAPTTTPNSAQGTVVQNQKFDGVQLVVKVHDQASWLIVTADNVEIYRGTMLAGASQTFSAANQLTLSVGNAGSVNVTLTNKQVVGKSLGNLGDQGEIKRDIQFNKDTNTL